MISAALGGILSAVSYLVCSRIVFRADSDVLFPKNSMKWTGEVILITIWNLA